MRTYKQRLNHLMQSEFIRSFDEYDPVTGIYKRDIEDADRKTFYLCDGKACGENHNCGECSHTTDVTHAKNFKYDGLGGYWEQSPTVELATNLQPTCNNLQQRPQGELSNEVWKLYKKYQSHLATRVIEFGDELKELLGGIETIKKYIDIPPMDPETVKTQDDETTNDNFYLARFMQHN